MPIPLKSVIRKTLLNLLSIGPIAAILDFPIRFLERWLRRFHNFFAKLTQNLYRFHYHGAPESKLSSAMRYYRSQREFIGELPYRPLMSIIIPVYKVKKEFLFETLQSIGAQTYPHWEVCIVDDYSQDSAILEVIERFKKAYPLQTNFKAHDRNMHISITSNSCLEMARGDYVVLLDHDDRLYPNALAEAVRYINLHDGPDILYSDECVIDSLGNRDRPVYHKPQWSPLLHLTMNYTTHLSIYRRTLIQEIGGFRAGFEGSQDHDLMLRAVEKTQKNVVHIPFNLYQWRAHVNSTAMSQEHKPYAADAGVKAVKEALFRRNRQGTVSFNTKTLQYRIAYDINKNPDGSDPLVSIIIPSKDSPQLIHRCLDSVFSKSTYKNFEIIVSDNGSTNQETLKIYDDFKRRFPTQLKIIFEKRPFNFGHQINLAAKQAKGSYYLPLNNDTEVITPGWIEEMLSLAQFPEIGAVGAKLLFSNGTIQHAGISLSTEWIAEHLGLGRMQNDDHYWNYHNTVHEVTAVTGACFLISKEKYWKINGFDSIYLPRAYGDIELCLALQDLGLSNVFTPYAVLYHHESASRGKAIEYFERFYLLTKRGQNLATDPYLNLNYLRNPRFESNRFYEDLDLGRFDFAQAMSELCSPQFTK